MDKNNKFKIDHIDPLGQGVFKSNGQVYFIPKTLPGEEGEYRVIRKRKGVNFCELEKLTNLSDRRITPPCPHFQECNGCHYLHTDYHDEIKFKTSSFKRLIDFLPETFGNAPIQLIQSTSRMGYRNRIQLHYDKKLKLIGFKRASSQKILEIPNCKIMIPELEAEFLYLIKNWQSIIPPKEPPQGHVELYFRSDKLKVSWNKGYAEGGFSQVNFLTNKLMQDYIHSNFKTNGFILDLFGGNGNISDELNKDSRAIIDLYPKSNQNPNQFSIDLYKKDAFLQLENLNLPPCELLILDPPRSGFKPLSDWISKLKPEKILYISCHPATMIRDLKTVSLDYKIQKIALIDLFPSTYHFEGLIYLAK